ncbi:hypothetical protein CPLU01_14159 [Colletotrichum plurivorum]|uniref:Uncharacterized protein n=1 Tax=Colletotrichum plurivorum TaxID=2175906 RepID=A0A8H6N0T9_9PEZI|nr:hypothetical protein CPLU01_14159 [Colletotrichum plurivorum]
MFRLRRLVGQRGLGDRRDELLVPGVAEGTASGYRAGGSVKESRVERGVPGRSTNQASEADLPGQAER